MLVHGPYPVGEPRVERQAQAARSAGWDVDVVAMRRKGEPSLEVVDGVVVVRLPLTHTHGAGLVRAFYEYVGFTTLATATVARRHRHRRYDVLHVHNPPDFLILAGLIPKATGARLIFDVHDLSSDMFEMRFGSHDLRAAAKPVLRSIEQAATRAADAVVTVHEPYRAELVQRGTPESKISVVMNTLDQRLLPENVEQTGHGFRIVYHGTITPHYGVDVVVEAFARIAAVLPDSRLEIYGEGDALSRLRRQVRDLDLDDRVLIGGFLSHRDVLRAVSGASVGVIPNRRTQLNGFALSSKLFEYVALGIPVVASSLPSLRAHFSDEEILFFEAGSAASLGEALLAVGQNPEEATRRQMAASRRYLSEYRWEIQAQRYCDVLEGISHNGTRCGPSRV
jgi:glycosyltransferase involved in cell wall biosynthesis